MKRILLLTIMLSFFGLGTCYAQKSKRSLAKNVKSNQKEKGVIGRYYEDGYPIIVKFINELPGRDTMSKLPFLTIISWKYNGNDNDGMPPTNVNKRMMRLESALQNSLKTNSLFKHAYSRTGNNLKEYAYYTTSQDDFLNMINKTLEEHDRYPIGINFYQDKEWTDFKKLMANFSN